MSTSGNTRTTLISPFQYFADPTKARPIFNGFIYIGRVDGDPTNPMDQIPVQVICECGGSPVNVTQPVRTGPGGLPIYNGQPAQIVVCRSNYSITLQDKDRVQVYHSPDVLSGFVNQPITHQTIAEAIAENNFNRTIILLANGGRYRVTADQTEYNNFPGDVGITRFTDVGGNLFVLAPDLSSMSLESLDFNTSNTSIVNANIFNSATLVQRTLGIAEITIGSGNFNIRPVSLRRNTYVRGAGRLNRTTLRFDLMTGEDGLSYVGEGFPDGNVVLSDLRIVNQNFPNTSPQGILDGKNRGVFGVGSDLGENFGVTDSNDWRFVKSSGSNFPKLRFERLLFENFAFAWDVHSWMCSIEDCEYRYCGTCRNIGTSTHYSRVWPQLVIHAGYQTHLTYSDLISCSLGETTISGLTPPADGIQNYGGRISLRDCGWENARGIIYNCFGGRINVHNETFVTDKTIKADLWGEIHTDNSFIYFYGLNQTIDADGDVTDATFNWFRSETISRLNNIVFEEDFIENNLPFRRPHLPFTRNFVSGNYRGLFGRDRNTNARDELVFTVPKFTENASRVSCLDLNYKNRFLLIGDTSVRRLRINIFGNLSHSVTNRLKNGILIARILPSLNFSSTGTTISSDFLNSDTIYVFNWANNGTTLISNQNRTGSGLVNTGDLSRPYISSFFNESVNNGGFNILIGNQAVNQADQDNAEYRNNISCIIELQYFGSCNNSGTGTERFTASIS